MSGIYSDYRYNFPIAGLATALQAMAALQAAGLLGPGDIPQNMLGDPRDVDGNVVTPDSGSVAWVGRPGSATAGDPTQYYIAIRAVAPAGGLPFDPTAYGLVVTDAAVSAAVLGVWE